MYWPDLIITSQESESGEDKRTGEIDVIFSGQAAGLYSVRLEYEGNLLRGFPVFIQTLESVWTMSAASNTLASTAMGTWTWNTLDPVDVGA